jgi:hypothetical protein
MNIFSLQANGAAGDAGRRFGGQDKTALTRGRAPSRQPEPLHKAAQSRGLSNKPKRTKKHGSRRRKTVHLVLWVNPIVKGELPQWVLAKDEPSEQTHRMVPGIWQVTTPKAHRFWLLGKRTPLWVTLPPDGSVRA